MSLQILLLGFALKLALMVPFPATAVAGFGVTAAALISRLLAQQFPRTRAQSIALAVAWMGSLTVWVSVAGRIYWDSYYAVPAGLTAAAVWLTARRENGAVWKARWNALVLLWLLCCTFMWLGGAYFQNQRGEFYAGLLAALIVLVLCRLWFRWGAVGAQALNTLILLVVGLPAVDLAFALQPDREVRPETCRSYYSFNAAKGDPLAFMRCKEFLDLQFNRFKQEVSTPTPDSILPYRLRPGSHGSMMNCPISINSLGFRGPEIHISKNGAYRIVALGESTTFGMTIQPGQKPWPELLEEIIHQRLNTHRPVQVINAGIFGFSLLHNLYRLPREILPLQPDMIISYHGANGFYLVDGSMLPPLGPPSPVYRERPLKLAADAEHRMRMHFFQYRASRHMVSAVNPAAQPLETKYAAAYRQLIQCARTNDIRLVLANYSMAVNQASSPEVVDFYNSSYAHIVKSYVRYNAIHSLIVSQLAAEYPAVCFVDTHSQLDGEHEKFIDLVHLTSEGDRQLAENMFAGIRKTLEQDLAPQ